jgi:hypothetical protein
VEFGVIPIHAECKPDEGRSLLIAPVECLDSRFPVETSFHQSPDAPFQRCNDADVQAAGELAKKDVASSSKEYRISPACQLINDDVEAVLVNLGSME